MSPEPPGGGGPDPDRGVDGGAGGGVGPSEPHRPVGGGRPVDRVEPEDTTGVPGGHTRSWSHRAWLRLWPAWVDRNVGIILAGRLAVSVARAISGVVTALYLAAEGFSAVEIGLLFLCVTLVSALLSTGIGMLSDRVGRKPFLVGVPLLATAAALVFAVDRSPGVLFAFAALGSFGRGAGAGAGSVGPYQPAESALVAESVPVGARAAAFGRLAFVSSLGALAGGLLAGLAHAHPGIGPVAALAAYRPAFLAAAVSAGAGGLIALGLREARVAPAPSGSAARSRRPRWPSRSWPALWRLWVTNGVNGAAIGLMGPFVSYWLYRRYGAGPGEIGLLFAIVNLFSLVSALGAAGVARRLGTVRAIVAVRAISGVLLVPMVLAPNFLIAGAVYILRMLAQRVGLPLRQSFTQDLADPEERASLAAWSNLPAQGTMAGSQVLAGYLFADVSLSAPFELSAVLQCVNAAAYALLFAYRPGRTRGAAAAPPGGVAQAARAEAADAATRTASAGSPEPAGIPEPAEGWDG